MQTTRIGSGTLYLSWPSRKMSIRIGRERLIRLLELHVEMLSRVIVVVHAADVLFRRARLGGQLQIVLNLEAAVAAFAVRTTAIQHCDSLVVGSTWLDTHGHGKSPLLYTLW